MIRRLDRYLYRELSFPFVLAVIGFILFILLNLILQLSDFMIDRDVPWSALLQILLYRLPDLVVLALPVAVLFATFLALGRLNHDRELIALQAGGVALRRVVLPVVVFGLAISALDLGINEGLVPWANHRYQTLLRQLLLRGAQPWIQEDTFFKDAQNRFFYVRRYDRGRKVLQDVLVYDLGGTTAPSLPGQGPDGDGPYPETITAKEATWDGQTWRLRDGVVHKYDDEGNLKYQARFRELTIQVGSDLQGLFLEQRTPREMSLRELGARIRTLRASGLRAEGLIVEFHAKLAIPLAALVFALFSAPLGLIFGLRGRAAGVVISVLLVGTYQGTLVWLETLARRGLIPAAWGPWLPDIAFGALGLILTAGVDRASRLEWGARLRRLWPLALALVLALALTFALSGSEQAQAQQAQQAQEDLPLELEADALEVGRGWEELRAQGDVRARYGDQAVHAQELLLRRAGQDRWRLSAQREVVFTSPSLRAEAQTLEATLTLRDGRLWPVSVTLGAFRGEVGPPHRQSPSVRLRSAGRRAHLEFEPASDGEGSADASGRAGAPQLRALRLEGQASVALAGTTLRAEEIVLAPVLERDSGESLKQSPSPQIWRAEARGEVHFEEGEGEGNRRIRAERLALDFVLEAEAETETPVLRTARLWDFRGRGSFENAEGQTHLMRYQGRSARLRFDGDGRLSEMEIEGGQFTTCDCSETIPQASYALSAERLWLWPDRWLFASGVMVRASGFPLFWTPFYLAPLRDIQENPLLPQIGRDRARGWFVRWRLPALVDPQNAGALLLDYYDRYREWGLGLDWDYGFAPQNGRLHIYHLVGRSEVWELAWTHRWPVSERLQLDLSLDRRDVLPRTAGPSRWAYQLQLTGRTGPWSWRARGGREESRPLQEGEEPPPYRALERLPELSLSQSPQKLGDYLSYSGALRWGRYREWAWAGETEAKAKYEESTRLDGQLHLGLRELVWDPLGLRLRLRAGGDYRLSLYAEGSRQVLQAQAHLSAVPLPPGSLTLDYLYRAVWGRTPFAFDRLEVAHRLSGGARLDLGALSATVGGAYALDVGRFEPWSLNVNARWGEHALRVSWTWTWQMGPLRLLTARLQEDWQAQWGRLSADLGYDFRRGRFQDAIVKGEVQNLNLRLGLRLDPNPDALALKRVNLEAGWELSDWSVLLRGEYDLLQGRWTALQAGLVRRFCHDCWQAGVYLSGQQIWFQAQINAFPGARLRYSPTDGKLGFGDGGQSPISIP